MKPVLSVDQVYKYFGGVRANENISMQVEQGAIVGLIGPNGSGKTTLFNSIVGTHPIDKGSIKFEDKEVSTLPVPVIAKLGLLRTFQQTRIYGKLNCIDNMRISAKPAKDNLFSVFSNIPTELSDKAEAKGIHTMRYKITGWVVSAFFVGMAGGLMGNMIGYIEPVETAFAGRTFGVFMVLMAILGGKGTLWGPVIGAIAFHIFKEGFWTFFLGWQYVALGALIVVVVIFFPEGIMGWLRDKYPERFGEIIDEEDRKAQVELK